MGILGFYRDNGIEHGNTMVYWGDIRIMETKMETTIVDWGYIGTMEKENGNYYSRLGLYRDNGKENGNYYSRLGLYRVQGVGSAAVPKCTAAKQESGMRALNLI